MLKRSASTQKSESAKRKHKTLSLSDKKDIIQRLENGEKVPDLAKAYGVGRTTIHDIRSKKLKILKYVETEPFSKNRHSMRTGAFPEVEGALFKWFLQERARGERITGDILCKKAKYFHQKIHNNSNFAASSGWLDNFKKRCGIRLSTTPSSDISTEALEAFQLKFFQKVDELDLTPDQIYIGEESGLFWKLLPQKFLEESHKDHITFMYCANATGMHKLQLMVVGKTNYPCVSSLPLIYKHQTKKYDTRDIISDWFHSSFVPDVRDFANRQNLSAKALLILDYFPGHPDENQLKSEDGSIQVMFMSPLLQQMGQIVIQLIKTHYKNILLHNIVDQNGDLKTFLQNYNLDDAILNLAHVWDEVESSAIASSWKLRKLLPTHMLFSESIVSEESEEDLQISACPELVQEIVKKSRFEISLTADDLNHWLNDSFDETTQVFIKDEVIDEVSNVNETVTSPQRTVSTTDAIDAFNTCIKWAEENDVSGENLLVLKNLQKHAQELKNQEK